MPDIFLEEDKTQESPKQPRYQRVTRGVGLARKDIGSSIQHTRHKMFPLAAFALDPDGVSFATQGEEEEIHLFLRRHFITNVPWIVLSIFLIIIPALVFPLLGSFLPFLSNISAILGLILTLFYYTIIVGFILVSFINWYFNVYIVTNERVVDVDFINLLYREVSTTRLNLVQDVTTKTGGAIRAIFDYGDVFVQTAGTEVNFDFHAVPRPQEVARQIEKLMREARKEEGVSELEEAIKK